MVRRIVPYLIAVCIISLMTQVIKAQSGAGSTSVYKTLYTGRSTPGASSVVPNIGQVGNQVFVVARNAPGHTCAVGTITLNLNASLQFSYDNVLWTNFGSPTNAGGFQGIVLNPPAPQGQIYFGVGLFPAVRFNVFNFDNVNCVLDAFYTGSSNSTQLSSSTIFTRSIVNTQLDTVGNAIVKQTPITMTGIVANGGSAIPLTGCEGHFSGTTSGSIRISDGAPNSSSFVCYMLVTTSSTTATFQIVTGTGPTCGTGTTTVFAPLNLTSSAPISIGSQVGVLFDVLSPNPVCAVVTGGPVSFIVGFGYR